MDGFFKDLMTKRSRLHEGRTPKVETLPGPSPQTPLFRKWSLSPWKKLSFLDVALSEGEDETTGLDVLNNLITQGGNYFTSQRSPYGTHVPRPGVGQAVPLASSTLGMSSTTLLLVGAAVLGVVMLAKRK